MEVFLKNFKSFLLRQKQFFVKKSIFWLFPKNFLHGIGSWYHKLSFKTLLVKIGSLFLEIFIIFFFSETRFGKMLFGQKVQKFWEHIKKLYRSLIYSLRAFIWYKYELCSLRIRPLLRPLRGDSLRCFAKRVAPKKPLLTRENGADSGKTLCGETLL